MSIDLRAVWMARPSFSRKACASIPCRWWGTRSNAGLPSAVMAASVGPSTGTALWNSNRPSDRRTIDMRRWNPVPGGKPGMSPLITHRLSSSCSSGSCRVTIQGRGALAIGAPGRWRHDEARGAREATDRAARRRSRRSPGYSRAPRSLSASRVIAASAWGFSARAPGFSACAPGTSACAWGFKIVCTGILSCAPGSCSCAPRSRAQAIHPYPDAPPLHARTTSLLPTTTEVLPDFAVIHAFY